MFVVKAPLDTLQEQTVHISHLIVPLQSMYRLKIVEGKSPLVTTLVIKLDYSLIYGTFISIMCFHTTGKRFI